MSKLITVPEILGEVRLECLNTEVKPLCWGDWTKMTEATYGWVDGILWVAGKPNHGKSSFVVNMIIKALENNPNIYIMDFTLDDSVSSRVAKYISVKMNIPLNSVVKEGFEQNERYISAISQGYEWLSTFSNLSIYDASWIVKYGKNKNKITIQDVKPYIEESYEEITTKNPNAEVLIVIDAFNDIDTTEKYASETEKDQKVAGELATLARVLKCRILSTGHVLKHIQMKGATQDILAGHRFLQYNAKGIWVIHHPLREDPTKTELYWTDPESYKPIPVISLKIAKNKMSAVDGYIFFAMRSDSGNMLYLPADDQDTYRDIISNL